MLATALGWAVAFPIANAILNLLAEAVPDEIVIFTMLGAAPGCLQWLVLRCRLPQAGWWVLASTLGLALLFGIFGAVWGTVTGIVLVWLMRESTTETTGLPSGL